MENPQDLKKLLETQAIDICTAGKKPAAVAHNAWTLEQAGILLYRHGSRNKTNPSGWYITANRKTIQERQLNMGTNPDILDVEIHAIREGINLL